MAANWRASRYVGAAVPFAPISPADDLLHALDAQAPFTSVETYLYGFNIPSANIYCNIYFLWHTKLEVMSAHVFVYRGARILPHQLAADYFNDHEYLPAVRDSREFDIKLGDCSVRHRVREPLQDIELEFADARCGFALDLRMRAALPPVGRPGGKHFTQLMRTCGQLTLDGTPYAIDGFYMRDRSWGYPRPETAERVPPYRWMTGWLGDEMAFVVAWLDTGLLEDERFGPNWQTLAGGGVGAADNKWESGGPTPSTNLRSGWIAVGSDVRQVTAMNVRSLFGGAPRLMTQGIELDITDATGARHVITGRTVAMIPKMYWQTMLTYMHAVELECGTRRGHGDLMDTFSGWHMREYGP